jgi:phosphatidylglycerol:prolipoprotein diacylglycerol transferase
MIPVLFQIGPFKVYSYGLMLGIGFLLGSYILSLELKRKKLDPNMASTVTVLAVIFGIAGAKILFLIEEWKYFVNDPIGMAFSPGGLTWYGGFALGLVAVITYVRRRKVPVLRFLDALGVALILAYGVARLGCHFSGDGDYGIPTTLPWGTLYYNGTYKPTRALADYFARNPEERARWHYDELSSRIAGKDALGNPYTEFDKVTPCQPTPVYEMILGVIGFAMLWRLRKNPYPDGKLFMIYLMLSSVFRFSVEFLRLNPRLLFGLSEAQLVSVPLFVAGLLIMLYLDRKQREKASESVTH